MKTFSPSFIVLAATFFSSATLLSADSFQENQNENALNNKMAVLQPSESIEPFTGQISKTKVRMRLQAAYDAHILKEMNPGDLVVVIGESGDFYSIQAPQNMKAYVYRTFVLDNVIEGNHVNVRLKPDLEAPIVAQLNSGDSVTGSIDPTNNKWLEIEMPQNAHFYIAKEYISKIGDAGLMARLEKKRENASQLLKTTDSSAKAEMMKPFDQINLNNIKANYAYLSSNFPEFPEFASQAKQQLASLLENYTSKKLDYLESQSNASIMHANVNVQLSDELNAHKSKIADLEQQIQNQDKVLPVIVAQIAGSNALTELPLNMSMWLPIEDSYFADWAQQTGNHSARDFYESQKSQAFVLKGVIDPYNRPVKNKPGDYMLISSSSKLPIAFLYSTQVNLQDYVGREVTVLVVQRPNNHFAFPAYYVLSLE